MQRSGDKNGGPEQEMEKKPGKGTKRSRKPGTAAGRVEHLNCVFLNNLFHMVRSKQSPDRS